jgi:hypothetical protein
LPSIGAAGIARPTPPAGRHNRRSRGAVQRDGTLIRPDGNGEPVAVNWSDMRELADKTICGVPLVRRDGVWREEYFTYRFDPPRRPDPSQGAAEAE